MIKRNLSKKALKKVALCTLFLMILLVCVKKYRDCIIYDDMKISVSEKVFEYGKNVNLKKFFQTTNKNYKYSIVKGLNTSMVGKQQVEVKVEYKGVAKVIPIQLDVVDSVAPIIDIKEDVLTIDEGTTTNLLNNISNVQDNDKSINYRELSTLEDGDNNYYTVSSNGFDYNNPGEYTISVVAVDQAGNRTEKSFRVVVNEVVKEPVYQTISQKSVFNDVVQNAASNLSGNDIVSIAQSLVGSSYVYGGNSPETGFDCSGFVQYVYSMVGKSVSRSSSTQASDGVGVSYENAEPGDILSWGHNGMVTHSAIYIGNGQMVHAMNSNTGVVISNVNGWSNLDVLMAVRRVA